MIRQNRAVPILIVITLAWVLYLAGCFGSEESETAVQAVATTVVPTPTPAPIVVDAADALAATEEPFTYTIEQGDLLATIAAKVNVTPDVILRANPDLNPNVLIVGDTLRIPGASTVNTVEEDREDARAAGEAIDYVVEGGDSFGLIATNWTVSVAALLEANPSVAPESLQIGQLIVVPPYGTGLSAEELAAVSTPVPIERKPGDPPIYHTVEPGDLISALAERYSVSVDEIMAFNNLGDPNQIVVGQELAIPPPSAATAVPAEPTATPNAGG